MRSVEARILCYNWMPILGPLRTRETAMGRAGSRVTEFDLGSLAHSSPTSVGEVSQEQLWENGHYFLSKVLPVAESCGITLAVHPDDPPVSEIRGVSRILISPDAVQRWLDLVSSPSHTLTFCQGTFSSMGADIPAEIRRFGRQGKIAFAHFRDVVGGPEKFVETWQDEGQTDMFATVQAYREVDFRGPMRVDHVPTMYGETQDYAGYGTFGRLYAIGYARGLIEAVAKQ